MSNLKDISILIVGTGAIGSLYAGKLSQIGIPVSAMCRSDYQSVKEKGIFVKSIWGDFLFSPLKTYHFSQKPDKEFDYVIVTLKVLPKINVSRIIEKAVSHRTTIVLLQNGIEIEKDIHKAFPENELISALAFVCASRTSYGQVDHQDYGRLVLGTYPEGVTEKTKKLGELFESSGVPYKVTDTIVTYRWQKLVWNAPFNSLSVLCGQVTTEQIMNTPETTQIARKIMQEVLRLAEKAGIPLSPSLIGKNLDDTKKMKPYKTSMCLDFEAGRPMEVEAILGNAVRMAKELNVSVPHLETIYGLLKLADEQNQNKKLKMKDQK